VNAPATRPAALPGSRTGSALHSHCWVCSPTNARGLAVRFVPSREWPGAVEARFDCDPVFEGYDGLIHGGIVSSLIDGAMVYCLFHQNRVAHTAALNVRFRHPVFVGREATVRAWVRQARGRLHVLAAELLQDGQVKVEASAKFMEAAVAAGAMPARAGAQGGRAGRSGA
jgi:acyl-coenzyme A thioesterase PaaI-like protein